MITLTPIARQILRTNYAKTGARAKLASSAIRRINAVSVSSQDKLQLIWCLGQLHSPDSPSAQVISAAILIKRRIFSLDEIMGMMVGKIDNFTLLNKSVINGQDLIVWRNLLEVGVIRPSDESDVGIIHPDFSERLDEARAKFGRISPQLTALDFDGFMSRLKKAYEKESKKSIERLLAKINTPWPSPFEDATRFQIAAPTLIEKQADSALGGALIKFNELAGTLGLFIETKSVTSRVDSTDDFKSAFCDSVEALFRHSVVTDQYGVVNNHFMIKLKGDFLALYLGPNRDGFTFGAICEPGEQDACRILEQIGRAGNRAPIFIPDFHPSIGRSMEMFGIGGPTLFALALDKFYRQVVSLANSG